ncbi:MAG: TIGR00296 family protein [Hadesarchaea archaeon]|nr:MAG: TIGR00296 family protein [Hadesarchaea archaeon]
MLTLKEGKLLVKLARKTIETYLHEDRKPQVPKVPAKLCKHRGVFVTLNKEGELRGCIGHPLPTTPLVDAVIDSAISSATRDPRFPPVTPEELPALEVEVSVLSKPEPIKVKSPREYPNHIVIGRDGLIIEWSGYAGLLLPQVPVEWGWDAEEFLSHACMKAGLMPDHWLREGVHISKFSAQVFRERRPSGEVEEQKMTQKE